MAYKLNEQRITPGGLNLLVPADQNPRRAALTDLINVPQGECLDLTDFWPGADGRLEQAPQPVLANNPAVVGSQNTLLATAGRVYYSDGTLLRQIGRLDDAPIDTGFDGFPLGAIAFQGFAWFMNTNHSSRDDGTALSPWWQAGPTSAPIVNDIGTAALPLLGFSAAPGVNGGSGNKSFPYLDTYFVTWVTTVGETNPSPVQRFTPPNDGGLHSFEILFPTGSIPACVTGWNIYRQVPAYGGASLDGDTTPYLLNPAPIPYPAQASYVDTGNSIDNQDDTSLLLLGTIMQEGMDPPPAARIVANQVYNGRIVVANSIANPNRMWFTNPLQPAFFPGSSDSYDGNWVDIGTDTGDGILAITVRPGFLTIYRQKSVWVHLGDCGSDSAIIEVAVPECGTVGPRAVCSTSASDYFIWVDGVYAFNNDAVSKLSFKVDRIWRGLTSENFPAAGPAYMSQCAIGHRNGRLYCSYPDSSGVPQVSLVLEVPSNRWFAHPRGWLAFQDIGTGFLGANGGVYTLESAYVATASALAFESQYHDCGLPDREKTWADLVVTHNTAGATLTVICRLNKLGGTFPGTPPAATSFTLATFMSSTLTAEIFPLVYPSTYGTGLSGPALALAVSLRGLPIKSFNLAIRVVGPGADGSPAIIESPILLHYYVEARLGPTFDSGPTNHGLEGVGTIDQVEIDCDNSLGTISGAGAAVLTLSYSIPGGILGGNSVTNIIEPTTGRQVVRWVVSPPVDGRLFRHQIAAANGIQIYGYKVRVLPIGVYCDGSENDVWYTAPLTPGIGGEGRQ